ncbi:hypothetical protein LX81_03230 [Palleronia aestuarii]|uniref:Uncharacterized protein n=1 Tax=Palleronia aestuarii TaxID=568105 RepID=A0A2W7PVT6_9RHOB|nr:hypothetical protein [Palleronia aestuarii]PZX13679.1 hypothetical protein LX81_03230 [Palleronia aestuarii]
MDRLGTGVGIAAILLHLSCRDDVAIVIVIDADLECAFSGA